MDSVTMMMVSRAGMRFRYRADLLGSVGAKERVIGPSSPVGTPRIFAGKFGIIVMQIQGHVDLMTLK